MFRNRAFTLPEIPESTSGGLFTTRSNANDLATRKQCNQLRMRVAAATAAGDPIYTSETVDGKPFTVISGVTQIDVETTKTTLYLKGKQLGKGQEGEVYEVQSLETGEWYAAKELTPGVVDSEIETERLTLSLLNRYQGFHNHYEGDKRVEITFMRLCKGQSLLSHMYKLDKRYGKECKDHFLAKKLLSIDYVFEFAQQALAELVEFKDKDIIHCDVNPSNIMARKFRGTSRMLNFAIIDFGVSIIKSKQQMQGLETTFGYLLQEKGSAIVAESMSKKDKRKSRTLRRTTSNRYSYDFSSDLISLAIIIAEMLSTENFQHYRIDLQSQIRETEGFQRPMTLDELKQGLADVLTIDAKAIEDKKHRALVSLVQKILLNYKNLKLTAQTSLRKLLKKIPLETTVSMNSADHLHVMPTTEKLPQDRLRQLGIAQHDIGVVAGSQTDFFATTHKSSPSLGRRKDTLEAHSDD